MHNYKEQLNIYAKQTNDALHKHLSCKEEFLQEIVLDAMRYSLLDAGKRIRAALVLEFGRICDASDKGAVAFACAIEMIHAYSLVHDDLPCMDNDDFRRGKPSCHRAFGEANALLAGDALLTLAFQTVAEASLLDAQRVQAICVLAKAAGAFGMIGGQVIDLKSEGHQVDLQTLRTLYELKTGALLRASAQLGCIAGNADAKLCAAADEYAYHCGLAFQITDDILDVVGDEQKLGKPVGSDAQSRKSTYVTLLGLQGARIEAEKLVQQAKRAVQDIPDHAFLAWMADMILTREQ